ncbi:glycoside hydrolase family 78 protein [Paraflavitalea pollutisoli]|uniref:glycoside hydrolase family 78 protein n=1 Tax=Paraflavitalea pollutisoli TaxID=3034143 RepID=UPI0023EB6433|nr:glycoside hydrolase family 78 protein [Paraflavitalea sp. H1-2-19X]
MNRIFLSLFIVLFTFPSLAQTPEPVYDLRVDHRQSPLGIDHQQPVFSWKINSQQRDFKQSGYKILIWPDPLTNGNSAVKMMTLAANSDNSTHIEYQGAPLQPATRYRWSVIVYDQHKKALPTSNAVFTTGLFTKTDWHNARWIGYEDLAHDSMRVLPGVHGGGGKLGEKAKQRPVTPLFRRSFTAKKKILRALAFVSGLGQYAFSVNGQPVDGRFLAPGWTYYDKTVLYNTYDVTRHLKQGDNTLGVVVGNGFHHINRERYRKLVTVFGMPKMICQLRITYTDGTTETIVSDQSWKTAPSAITYNSIFGGEDYDAQLEQKGWNQPSFKDNHWKQALLVTPPKGQLQAEADYPLQVMQQFTAKKVSQPVPGQYVYDFGQNTSGIVEIKVTGKKGQTIKLTPAELINEQQLANQKATGSPYYFSYTLKGDGEETWRPAFSYYGFRYVQVDGAVPDTAANKDEQPVIKGLTLLHTRNAAPANGSFTSSNDLFNRIDQLILWGIKGNFQSVLTDCPHREKLGWLEQDFLMGASVKYNFETYNLYNKLIQDMMDAQLPNGLVPDIAPEYVLFDGGFRDSPEWGSASIILPWLQYKWYGDTSAMRKAWPMMVSYLDYLESTSKHHILSHGLGDWYDLGPDRPGFAQLTPMGLTATAIYYYDATLLRDMAQLLGKPDAVSRYARLAGEIKQTFNDTFFNKSTKVYSTGSQTAMAMPLALGLVDEPYRAAVLKNLEDSIRADGKKLTAGDVGFHYLVQALQEGGASQLLYEMNSRDDVPGYGYQLRKGATALTESWPALEVVSNNHLMLGHIMEWFYGGLAGIRQTDKSVGFRHILLQPEVVGDITYVKGSYESLYGTIRSEWKKTAGSFTWKVSIPANTTATVYIPGAAGKQITEGGRAVKPAKTEGTAAVVEIGSGDYIFVVQ